MIKLSLACAICAFTITPLTAQHTVTYNGTWVHNGTSLTAPQNNTNSQVLLGSYATANAQADYATARIGGLALAPFGVLVQAQASASGSGQGSYTRMTLANGSITCTGNTTATGSANNSGGATGNFSSLASYSNSIGVNANASASWPGMGSVILSTPVNFAVAAAARTFSWQSSASSTLFVQSGSVGSGVAVSGQTKVTTTTNLF